MKKLVIGMFALVVAGCAAQTKRRQFECQVSVASVDKDGHSYESASALTLSQASTTSVCPEGMVLVDGDYCPDVEQECLHWVDATGAATEAPKPGMTGRCGEWRYPSKCLSLKVHKRFCIDRYEYPNVKGERPKSWMTWETMKAACEAQGKRLPTRSEWTFACEGPDMKPYPYGDGYHRDRTACNFDNPVPKGVDVFKSRAPGDEMTKRLDAMLVPSGSMPRCVSPFGVFDMVGNIDESVVNETGKPYVSGLMSGHVFGVRNACRPMTEAHGPSFGWYETGGRCALSLKE